MNIVQNKIANLENDERVIELQKFLDEHQSDLRDVLLDVIHMSFVAGFEVAIDSTIASFS